MFCFFFSSRRRHTRLQGDWSSDVCSSDLVPDLKKAVARKIRDFVENGGFLFAMCTATETIDLALAAEGVGNAAPLAGGTPPGPPAGRKIHRTRGPAVPRARGGPDPPNASLS